MKQCHNALKFEQCLSWSRSSVEDTVPCNSHMHKLLIEKVMTLIFVLALDEASSSNKGGESKESKIYQEDYQHYCIRHARQARRV
jgi:hypothetical protein